jgi:phosphoserine phosphatase
MIFDMDKVMIPKMLLVPQNKNRQLQSVFNKNRTRKLGKGEERLLNSLRTEL